ncbi:MAG: DUF3822 family protein [Dysgonamonadaceae bacterium]|jgi:hypothetical protein|nr:DUF3822 family protein [Dysgonamonadaceae bacterium]
MEIRLPEHIDTTCPDRYALIINVYPERFSFSLYPPEHPEDHFYYCFPSGKAAAFSQFREAFFDNAFFTYPFRKVRIVNHSPVYTFVPNWLFEEKDKETYLQFSFTSPHGKILHQTLSNPNITILHTLPEDIYGFLQRSFPEASVAHHTSALIAWCQEKGQCLNANRMFIFRTPSGMDVLCFSRQQLLLSNYFQCESVEDAIYYALYVYKQLKFSQLQDFVHLSEAEEKLRETLSKYIQNVMPCENNQWEIQESAV